MPLVDYSSSESESEESGPKKLSTGASKASFQKVVSSSNPRKIVVNLPTIRDKDGDNVALEEPATKRSRTGGAFSGLNSFLPAPKRTVQSLNNGARKGVGLRTAAEPAFNRSELRRPEATPSIDTAELSDASEEDVRVEDEPIQQTEIRKSALVFKPLSVARKMKKPFKSTKMAPESAAETTGLKTTSLFSISTEDTESLFSASSGTTKSYQPIVFNPESSDSTSTRSNNNLGEATPFLNSVPELEPSLTDIAADLNLTPSERRRLLGRRGGMGREVQIKSFNMDNEYASNHAAILAGEAEPAVNPVRSIAPGKHSLQQLLNAASSQREALEESFAAGKRNKKEAGSKYGW